MSIDIVENRIGEEYRRHEIPLGVSIPAYTPHAVSVSLPKWQDNIDYEEGIPRVLDQLQSGYPRFCLHKAVKQLGDKVMNSTGYDGVCYPLPSRRVVKEAQEFIERHAPPGSKLELTKTGEYPIPAPEGSGLPHSTLHFLLLPKELESLGKSFWQHTGEIVSSRYAEYCLRNWDDINLTVDNNPTNISTSNHSTSGKLTSSQANLEMETYLEERYGRNLSIKLAEEVKVAMRRRIAAGLQLNEESLSQVETKSGNGIVSSDDVYLYPTGMSAIYNAHRLALELNGPHFSVCFGFPYTDTLKILQKFGPGCHFLGYGDETDLTKLETLLTTEKIAALFCEFPTNPLLRSPPLRKIRALADKYDFLIIVDDTIGGFVNLRMLEVADITVSSLTKIFSGDSNVMGGSLTLSSRSSKYRSLQTTIKNQYEDLLWCEDAIFLERNSRTFETRVRQINLVTEQLCDFLKDHPLVKRVHYPKYSTPSLYRSFLTPTGGYGGLFSIEFQNPHHAPRFYDHLPCPKGPSLGTNFTLSCPYPLLAHYTELPWAQSYGIDPQLLRISVGLEGIGWLKWAFGMALDKISEV